MINQAVGHGGLGIGTCTNNKTLEYILLEYNLNIFLLKIKNIKAIKDMFAFCFIFLSKKPINFWILRGKNLQCVWVI